MPSALELSFEVERERMPQQTLDSLKMAPTPEYTESTKNHFKIGPDSSPTEEGFSMTQISEEKN